MLNIGKLAVGGGEYYLEVVASGVEDYYLGAGEAPGWWTGAAAHRLGLSGRVTASDLQAVLAGQHPRTGQRLRRGDGKPRLPGFDLTFRAPKSVSLLWALTPPEIGEEVRAAHDRAVQTALTYLQRHALATRRGAGGTEIVDVDGAVAAAFRHRTSRAGDPLVHTHVLVANLAHTPDDGRWRTLHGRRLYQHAKTAGYVYQAALRHELTIALGVAWAAPVNGTADVDGVPREVIDHFSRRRADILAALDAVGQSSAKAAQVATLTTRQRKEYGVSHATLYERWTARAEAIGFGTQRLERLLFTETRRLLDGVDVDRITDQLAGPDGLTATTSTFTRRDVVRAWCDRLPRGATLDVLEQLTDATLAHDTGVFVRLTPPHLRPGTDTPEVDQVLQRLSAAAAVRAEDCPPLRDTVTAILTHSKVRPDVLADRLLAEPLDDARDHLGVLTWRARIHATQFNIPLDTTPTPGSTTGTDRFTSLRPDETVYSTPDLLRTEQQALHQATTAVATVACDPAVVDAALAGNVRLSDEQAVMVRQITTGVQGVQVVVGRAGTGKTTALAAAVPLWRQAGCTVVGVALAARTAQQLGEEAGIPAATIDRLLAVLDANPPRHTDVIVVDEAAMVGTRTLARLIDHTTAVGARLVLVGDHHQLPEIDAGGLFRALARHPHTVELTTNRRQHDPAERAAVDALRDGHDTTAVDHFTHPARHQSHETAEDAIRAVVEGWWADRQAGLTTTMLAARTDQVDWLNTLARQRLADAGHLYGLDTPIGTRQYRIGDAILCLRNDRRLGVLNGTTAVIDAIDPATLTVHATTTHGHAITLPASYTDADGITHAYATTVHKSQGRTVDTTHVLLDDTAYREMTYVMLSRHRHTARIHRTQDPAVESDGLHPTATQPIATADISTALRRTHAQRLAHDAAPAR